MGGCPPRLGSAYTLPPAPRTGRHLLVGLAGPLCYDNASVMESARKVSQAPGSPTPNVLLDLWRQIKPVGNAIGAQKETFEGRDDLRDGYNSDFNQVERNRMLNYLFTFAEKNHFKLSFLSGDVDLCCVGEIEAQVGGPKECRTCTGRNWVTSPMTNIPASKTWAEFLAKNKDAQQVVMTPEMSGRIVTPKRAEPETNKKGKSKRKEVNPLPFTLTDALPEDGILTRRNFLIISKEDIPPPEPEASVAAKAVKQSIFISKKELHAAQSALTAALEKAGIYLRASFYVERSHSEAASEFDVYRDVATPWQPVPVKQPLCGCCSLS